MTKNNKYKKPIIAAGSIMTLLALMLTLGIASLVGADAPPSMPNQFFGTVKNNGAVVNAGYTVSAKTGSTQLAATTTDSAGRYGYSSAFYFAVPDGETIEFWVNGIKAAQTAVASAGAAIEVDLTVSGANNQSVPVTTTPAPTTAIPAPTTTAAVNYPTPTPSIPAGGGSPAPAAETPANTGSGSSQAGNQAVNTAPPSNQGQAPAQPVQSPATGEKQGSPVKESSSNSEIPIGIILIAAGVFVILIILIRILVMLRQGPHHYR